MTKTRKHVSRMAFTMAEILLSLTIIGVVAAITLPSLTGNINERTWNTQRKALYARMSQAISLMPALNGYGTVREASGTEGTESYDAGFDNAAETFVTAGLSKVLKINNICDNTHLSDCGVASMITPIDGGDVVSVGLTLSAFNQEWHSVDYQDENEFTASHYQTDTKAVAFETVNGESIVLYYAPQCQADMAENSNHVYYPKVCLNFIYDLNGAKGPNTAGKDIGAITVFYPTDSLVVAPVVSTQVGKGYSSVTASQYCRDLGEEYRLPNRFEAAALALNKKLWSNLENTMVTGSPFDSTYSWTVGLVSGFKLHGRNATGGFLNTYCIKR